MKLNLGCGINPISGYVNVDKYASGLQDQVFDLETFPWPWANDSVTEVVLNHVMEHLGFDPKVFLRIMQELYRVCADEAQVHINVPHPRHDSFLNDPTHVRTITQQGLQLFDRRLNDEWASAGNVANSLLAHQCGVDFEVQSGSLAIDPAYLDRFHRGELTHPELDQILREHNNIVTEIRMTLLVHKAPS